MDRKGKRISRYSVENFLCHSAEKFRRGILYCCIHFVCRKSLDQRKGISRIYVEIFLSRSAERLRRGILYCFIDFGYLKGLDKRGGGRFKYSVEIFFLTVPKVFVGESFTVALISGIEKVWIRGRGEIKIFRRKFFVSQCRKIFVGESFTVALNSCSEKVYGQEGEKNIKIFRRKFFVSQCRKIP